MLLNQEDLFKASGVDTSTETKVVNVSSVPQRSPFRYPGGKTWFVPDFRRWIAQTKRPKLFIEPFAGGATIGLTAAFEGLAESVLIVEKDPMVAAVWRTILGGDAEWLAQRILDFDLSIENCRYVLDAKDVKPREEGFKTILRNRINHGGILAAGSGMLKNGEGGKGIASRWYPETLAKRIRAIDSVRSKISFLEGDGIAVMESYQNDKDAAFFIDPPYTAGAKGKRAGKRLYVHFELDHGKLFDLVAAVKGNFLMTYDDDAEVMEMAKVRNLTVRKVPMRGTHHRDTLELVIMPTWSSFS